MSDRLKCYTSGDEIKFLDEMTEENKPEFHDLTDCELMSMFKDLIVVDDTDISGDGFELPEELTYEVHGIDWYMTKFPGFTYDQYQIMVDTAKAHNAMVLLD